VKCESQVEDTDVSFLVLLSSQSREIGIIFFHFLLSLLFVRKGVSVLPSELSLDEFVQFLIDHSDEVVGYSGISFFHNPLAEWLSQRCRALVAVDTYSYGCVSSPYGYPLPRWGRLLVSWMERCTPAPLTGETVFLALSQVEAGLQLQRL
jgi:hypothetical protein